MTGKALLKRIAVVTLGAAVFFLFAAVVGVNATPIRPDVKKLLAQPQETPSSAEFVPARAGWDGPETPKAQVSRNATLELLSPAAAARAARESLRTAAIPDPRALAAVVLVIFLLRRMRKFSLKAKAVRPNVGGPALSRSEGWDSNNAASPTGQPVGLRPAA